MNYELSFIINSLIPETDHKSVQENILGYIAKIGGKINREPYSIGRKKLTYPIKKQKHGFYVFLEFELEDKAGLKELDKQLRLNNNILRHLIIKKDKSIGQDLASLVERPRPKPGRRSTAMTPRSRIRKPLAVPLAKTLIPKEDRLKIDLGDMDKRLDAILEEGPKID
jgi:small subunit ribosomal protein S6